MKTKKTMSDVTSNVEGRVGYQLKRAQQALRAAMDHALRELGLTTAQYATLAALEVATESAAPLSGAELARRCFVTPQTMNEILVGLERGGLIARRPISPRARVIESHLTARGRTALGHAHAAVEAIERRMLAGFKPAERARLAAALARCADQVASETA